MSRTVVLLGTTWQNVKNDMHYNDMCENDTRMRFAFFRLQHAKQFKCAVKLNSWKNGSKRWAFVQGNLNEIEYIIWMLLNYNIII